jgi:RES domain-containing protein
LRVYRAFERKRAATAFSGEGARLYGGRWNSVGTAILYTSQTFSLALLEIMVNAASARLPSDMVYVPIDIPDSVLHETLDVAALPKNWSGYPPPPECQRAGDSWARRGETVALVVPSAVARIERNVLLNPAHPDFARFVIGEIEPMTIDARLRLRTGASRPPPRV